MPIFLCFAVLSLKKFRKDRVFQLFIIFLATSFTIRMGYFSFSKWGSASSRYHLSYVYLLLLLCPLGIVLVIKIINRYFKRVDIVKLTIIIIIILFAIAAGKSFRHSGKRKLYRSDSVPQIINYLADNKLNGNFILYSQIGEMRNLTYFGAKNLIEISPEKMTIETPDSKEIFLIVKKRKQKNGKFTNVRKGEIVSNKKYSFLKEFLLKLNNIDNANDYEAIKIKEYKISRRDIINIYHIRKLKNNE